eukprot:TRINITY_DN4145_c0_g1_i1.p1 TRINITY_DN4145_c0_g1~~TRINITY_DN4145_c0_g1_i1.p1  ORF type:complete len:193 (+),score=24.52 TRINITY_DN4145_c0_g1_i1:58-636(+)
MASIAAKILIVGPSNVGKSVISNMISEFAEQPTSEYVPTVGVRILECERSIGRTDPRSRDSMKISVEIWDCSGDRQFERCWPAIAKDADGVVFVLNPYDPRHLSEIEIYHKAFAGTRVKDNNCQVFAHRPANAGPAKFKIASKLFDRIAVSQTTMDPSEGPSGISAEFNAYLSRVVESLVANRERDERALMN